MAGEHDTAVEGLGGIDGGGLGKHVAQLCGGPQEESWRWGTGE